MANSTSGGAKSKTAKRDQVMSMWGASLVVAFLFVILFGIQTFYVQEEAEIRRESYLANLEQLYQQETQECFGLSAFGSEDTEESAVPAESETQCLERINQDGRYAQLIRKWGGEDLLIDSLSQ